MSPTEPNAGDFFAEIRRQIDALQQRNDAPERILLTQIMPLEMAMVVPMLDDDGVPLEGRSQILLHPDEWDRLAAEISAMSPGSVGSLFGIPVVREELPRRWSDRHAPASEGEPMTDHLGRSDDSPRFPPDDLKVDFGKPAETLKAPGFMARVRAQKREDEERREREMRDRADRARADAIASFVAYPGHEITHAWVCPYCTAVITDRERHLNFHGHLNDAAQQARRASIYTTPIG